MTEKTKQGVGVGMSCVARSFVPPNDMHQSRVSCFFSLKHKNWFWFKHKGLRITRAGVRQAAGGLWKYVRQLERQVPGIRSLTEHQLATSYPISTKQQKVVNMIFLNSPKVSKNISVGCGGLQRASDMIKDWHLWRVILFIFKAEVCAVLKWRDKEALVSSR